MDWNNVMNEISDYVEQHLQRDMPEIDHNEIAKMANCSFSFFQKVFSYLNGFSFSEYLRFRKLTLAGYDLKSSDIKVIEVSYKYGYDSSTSFTKAFQKFHGFSPSEARTPESQLNIFPRVSANTHHSYSWYLERKSQLRLIGKKWTLSTKEHDHYQQIPKIWESCVQSGIYNQLLNCDEGNNRGVMGLFVSIDQLNETIDYAIMVESTQILTEGWTQLDISENTWAVFNCIGVVPRAIQEGWSYLNKEWLINYPFKHAEAPEIEWYSTGNQMESNYLSQIWIPIIEED